MTISLRLCDYVLCINIYFKTFIVKVCKVCKFVYIIGVYSRKVCKKYVKSMYEVCQTTYYNHTAEGIKKTILN